MLAAAATPARAEAGRDLCSIAYDWLIAGAEGSSLSPQDLCMALEGENCASVATRPEAVCHGFRRDQCGDWSVLNGPEACRASGGDVNCDQAANVGNGICYAVTQGGPMGTNCGFGTNTGIGLCFAMGGANCEHSNNVGQGFCYGITGGSWGSNCSFAQSAEQGLCFGRYGTNCDRIDGGAEINLLAHQCGWL